MTIVEKDAFGIAEMYPTSAYGFNNRRRGGNGWEYYADFWNQRKIYEFIPNGEAIPEQSMDFYMHYRKVPNSFGSVRGDGTITLTSNEKYQPLKLSIYDDNNLYYGTKNALTTGKRWTSNVEFTMYFAIKAYPLTYGIKGGISMTVTSDHHFIDIPIQRNAHLTSGYNPYNSHEYTFVMKYDGHMYLTGQPYHGYWRDQKPAGIYDIDLWDTNFQGIPLNNLIGIKLIKRVVDTKNVFLEVWRDTTGGLDGGTWRKIIEFKHIRGNWYNSKMDILYATSLANSSYSILPVPVNVDDPHADGGGGMCQISIDPIQEIDLKWVSCRDIEPTMLPPVTTDSDLTTDSEYYNDNETDVL